MKKNIKEQAAGAAQTQSDEGFLKNALDACFKIDPNTNISGKYGWFKLDTGHTQPVKLRDGRFAIKGFKIKFTKTEGVNEDIYFLPDKTVVNATTGNKKLWDCTEIAQTIGTTQDVSKLTPNQQLQVSDQKMKDEGWTEDIPVDPENWDVYTKIPGITLYRQKALSNIRPNQIEKLKLVLKEKGYTLRQPDYGTPEYDYAKTNPTYLSTVLDKYDADAIGITDLSTKIYKLDISDTAPKKKEDVKKDIAAIKNAPRYTALECKTNIENLYNNSPSTTKKPRKFTPLTDEYAIEDAKNIVMACIAQQGIDGFTVARGYDAGLFGVSTDDQVRQLTRDKGKYGLKFKYDNWKTSQRTGTNESVEKDLRKILHENLISIKENNKKVLTEETKIVKNRFRIIGEGRTIKTKKDRIKLSDELINEMVYLNSQGFDKQVINESFWDILSGLFPKGVDSIFDTFKERGIAWLMEKIGLNPNSWLGSVVVTGLGDIDIVDIPKLFSDCNFATKVMSKAIAEGTVRQLQQKYTSDSAVADILRNTVVEVLSETELGQKLESAIGSLICPLISNLSGKLKTAASEITDKAVGAKEDSGMLSKLGLS
jgi:hypothetical protein